MVQEGHVRISWQVFQNTTALDPILEICNQNVHGWDVHNCILKGSSSDSNAFPWN